jgi:hypothetical protein
VRARRERFKSVKRRMRKVIRTGRLILCHLLKSDFETIIYFSARDWNFESDGIFEGGNHGSGAFDHSDCENFPVASEDFLPVHCTMFSRGNLLWRVIRITGLPYSEYNKYVVLLDVQTSSHNVSPMDPF